MTTRRRFLQAGLLASAAVAFPGRILFGATPEKKPAMTLGLQTYALRKFPLPEILKITREAGIPEVEISGGASWGGKNKEEREQLRALLEANKVRAISLGGCQGTVEQFEFAKEMGMQFLQGEPPLDTLVAVSQRAEEYGVRFALHNHPKASLYWDYQENLKRVKDCAPALGFCPDTGHYMRSGFDPLQVIRDFKGRIVSVHLKDLKVINPGEENPRFQDTAWGTGKGQIEAILNELTDQEYAGPVIIEYDHIYDDGNVEEIRNCAEFFRKFADKAT